MDHIDAIIVGLDSLQQQPFSTGNRLRDRAMASFIERSLNLAGYEIVPKEPLDNLENLGLPK